MLPDGFPFQDVFEAFLHEYAECTTYWYVPHTRALNDENAEACASVLQTIYDGFLSRTWNRETQDDLLDALRDNDVLDPYQEGALDDRTALTRIWKVFLETLGFLWVQEDKEIIITDAGLDLLDALDGEGDLRTVVSEQIGKLQYPHPGLDASYRDDFEGILPHLFLLQVLDRCDEISKTEFDLFVNLAQSQDDLDRIVRYIRHWRDLSDEERESVEGLAKRIPWGKGNHQLRFDDGLLDPQAKGTRSLTIKNISSYQRSIFGYPGLISTEDGSMIAADATKVSEAIEEAERGLKLTIFETLEDWITYYGDPTQRPSWFTYVSFEVSRSATQEEARAVVERHKDELEENEQEEVERLEIEKGIEDFFVTRLSMLADHRALELVDKGRQYTTPIGRLDLLCRDEDGMYVVVEIKADDATDSVFGQILRYMGWVHRNIPDGEGNVRGIILAGSFPEKARYSRIGLLRDDYEEFIQFKRHGLAAKDS